MRSAIWPAATTILMLMGPAHAERPDCALFPDTRSRFACYDNVSRAPSPEPADAAKPALLQPKAATRHRYTTPARRRSP